MPFEFDSAKSALTKADPNRRISFDGAQAIWIDQNRIELTLPLTSEPRTAVIGRIGADKKGQIKKGQVVHLRLHPRAEVFL